MNVQTFYGNADFTKAQKLIEMKVNTFLVMYMNSRDVIICYLELRKTQSVFPIPLEFEISKFACTSLDSIVKMILNNYMYYWQVSLRCYIENKKLFGNNFTGW